MHTWHGNTLEFCSEIRTSRWWTRIGIGGMGVALVAAYLCSLYPRENSLVCLVFGAGGMGLGALLGANHTKYYGKTVRFTPEAVEFLRHRGHGAERSKTPVEHFRLMRGDITRVDAQRGLVYLVNDRARSVWILHEAYDLPCFGAEERKVLMTYLAATWPEQFLAGQSNPWPPEGMVDDDSPPGWNVMRLVQDRSQCLVWNPEKERWV